MLIPAGIMALILSLSLAGSINILSLGDEAAGQDQADFHTFADTGLCGLCGGRRQYCVCGADHPAHDKKAGGQ